MFRQIADFFTRLFDDTDWPPKWHCGRWTEFHGWLYIVSDLLIWAAYFSIPLAIIRYISKKQGLPFLKLYFLFAAFILACGSTHFLDAIAFWIPVYRLNALVRLITGVLSWITVFSVIKLLPQAFSLRSPQELEAEIAQRKQAEEQSRDNEAQIQTIFDAAPDAIIVMDEHGMISKWNPRAEVIFGWTAGEVTGKSLNEIIIPHRYRDAHQKGLTRFLETGKSMVSGKTIEIQALDKTGAELDVALRISPAVRQGRRHFIGFVRDISEQKKAKEEIQKLNETLEQRVAERTDALKKSIKEISDYKFALDEAAIVAITNQKGVITHVNDNFCKISKYSAEELIGQDHRIINSGYHPAEYIRHLWVTIANGKIWRGELMNRAKDRSIYWVDTTIIPFLDEKSKPYQYVAIRADITDRKKAEEELHKLNEELENRISLRTAQLETATREMEAFAYSVSHDLRAPLRGITGFASILEEEYAGKLDAEALRITAVIINNAQKMGRLIDDLLAFSRTSRQDIIKTTIPTPSMVQAVTEELTAGMDASSVEWEVHPLPKVRGDMAAIRQVWVNLLSNALKYSAGRKPARIEVGSYHHEGQIAFFVKDNGVGFDSKYKSKLFRVFQRLHTADQFEGTGIGLALVEKIISKHGGSVWAESEPGNGACFTFSLPVE